MRYRVWHKTTYRYATPAPLSHNQARVYPRPLDHQAIASLEVVVEPEPQVRRLWADPYGNLTEFFSIETPHELMSVTATSIIERTAPPPPEPKAVRWRELAAAIANPQNSLDREASAFRFESKHCPRTAAVAAFIEPSLRHEHLDAVAADLMRRIRGEFRYQPASTTIDTTTDQLLSSRKGVCQDFAHLMVACLRSAGLPARYVSGYILTRPAPGQPKLTGVDASHAWVGIYFGGGRWYDYDPTNDMLAGEEHITLAWGRDYTDVSPVQGVLVGGGSTKMSVNVDMSPLP